MTLGQFAAAIPASPKWVLNAHPVLGLTPSYSVRRARIFALARLMEQAFGIPLKRSYVLARRTLRQPDEPKKWCHELTDGAISLVVDRERFLSNFTATLSLALAAYSERRRGRPPRKRSRGISAARKHGVDIGLLEESLKRDPGTRLKQLDEDATFVRSLKVQRS